MLTSTECVKADSKFSQARDEFWFDTSVDGVIDALVRRWQNVVICFTYFNNLGHFPAVLEHRCE